MRVLVDSNRYRDFCFKSESALEFPRFLNGAISQASHGAQTRQVHMLKHELQPFLVQSARWSSHFSVSSGRHCRSGNARVSHKPKHRALCGPEDRGTFARIPRPEPVWSTMNGRRCRRGSIAAGCGGRATPPRQDRAAAATPARG